MLLLEPIQMCYFGGLFIHFKSISGFSAFFFCSPLWRGLIWCSFSGGVLLSGISCIEYPIGNIFSGTYNVQAAKKFITDLDARRLSVLFWDLTPFELHVCAGYNLEG